jgi:hypothetical protein
VLVEEHGQVQGVAGHGVTGRGVEGPQRVEPGRQTREQNGQPVPLGRSHGTVGGEGGKGVGARVRASEAPEVGE